MLGPSYILACGVSGDCDATKLTGCNGGIIAVGGLENMANPAGSVPSQCWDYSWCANDDGCSKGGGEDQSSSKAPRHLKFSQQCVSDNNVFNLYRVKPNSIYAMTSFDQIKQSIFDKGPMPTGYYVYTDFFLGTKPGADNWATTGNIYVHMDGRSR